MKQLWMINLGQVQLIIILTVIIIGKKWNLLRMNGSLSSFNKTILFNLEPGLIN